LPIAKILLRSAEDRVRAYIIERLMCSEAVNLRSVMEHAEDHIQASEIFLGGLAALEPMAADKLVELGPDTINVTPLGRLFVRNIASVYDTYLPKHRTGPAKTFSQAL
ncbi:MAG: coproporphyrinogen III oxidase, partial [Deltaproteobacteria bacterium]|nr:coproporphyrinogen III oxidase [Deltaproteobacteria bacterium]